MFGHPSVWVQELQQTASVHDTQIGQPMFSENLFGKQVENHLGPWLSDSVGRSVLPQTKKFQVYIPPMQMRFSALIICRSDGTRNMGKWPHNATKIDEVIGSFLFTSTQ